MTTDENFSDTSDDSEVPGDFNDLDSHDSDGLDEPEASTDSDSDDFGEEETSEWRSFYVSESVCISILTMRDRP